MAKTTKIDFMKLMKDKSGSDFMKKVIGEAFTKAAFEEIKNTVENSREMSLASLSNSDDDWVNSMLFYLVNSMKSMSKFQEVANSVVGKNELQEDFKNNTYVTMEYSKDRISSNLNKMLETTITISPKGGPNAEDLWRLFATVFIGGETNINPEYNGGDEKTLVLNPTPGFNQVYLDKASNGLRDYFMKKFQDKVEESLDDQIKEEIKKFEEK